LNRAKKDMTNRHFVGTCNQRNDRSPRSFDRRDQCRFARASESSVVDGDDGGPVARLCRSNRDLRLFSQRIIELSNVYWSRPLTPTRNDTHRGKSVRPSSSHSRRASYTCSDGIHRPAIPAERWIIATRPQVNVPHAQRRPCFIANELRVNTPTTGRLGSSPPTRRGSARAYRSSSC